MALSVSRDTNIIPRALARGMILVEGWYGMWYGKSHIIFSIYQLEQATFRWDDDDVRFVQEQRS